jgi:hypothetical protein
VKNLPANAAPEILIVQDQHLDPEIIERYYKGPAVLALYQTLRLQDHHSQDSQAALLLKSLPEAPLAQHQN